MVALGAAVAAVAAARYRLSVEFVPAVIIFAVFAGTVPAWVDGAFARAWPAAVCLFSAGGMLLAGGGGGRGRGAPPRPGWGRVLERGGEAGGGAKDRD